MNVSSAGAAQVAKTLLTSSAQEAKEVPGAPDNDGDGDDGASAARASAPAALPSNVGRVVDKTA